MNFLHRRLGYGIFHNNNRAFLPFHLQIKAVQFALIGGSVLCAVYPAKAVVKKPRIRPSFLRLLQYILQPKAFQPCVGTPLYFRTRPCDLLCTPFTFRILLQTFQRKALRKRRHVWRLVCSRCLGTRVKLQICSITLRLQKHNVTPCTGKRTQQFPFIIADVPRI